MEFIAVTKDGIYVMDAEDVTQGKEGTYKDGVTAEGSCVRVVAKLPSSPNAFGHCWSRDGELLASVCEEGIRLYDCNKGYTTAFTIDRVAPDVGGRSGGVRNASISPLNTHIVTYEKWDPQYLDNVHVWCLEGEQAGKRLYSTTLKGYTSGALPLHVIKWTADEAMCLEMMPGKGLIIRENGFDKEETRIIPEKSATNFELSPLNVAKSTTYVATFQPESSSVARVAVYDLTTGAKTAELHLPGKVKDCSIMWNFDGTAILVLATSDVDETGCSYFGTSYLFWLKPDSKVPVAVYGAKDGTVQDIAWSPTANEFMAIVGAPPSSVVLHDGKTSKVVSTLGRVRRNTLRWNPFGRFCAVGGFGTLAGDLDFFDRSKEETIASLRAPLTVGCTFGPDGRQFLTCTVAPRMNEGNQISMFKYTGELLFRIDYVPEVIEARHEDTGAGARTKTQALLYAASWRPLGGERKYEDRAASPPKVGKRKKGLPDASVVPAASTAGAYRPKGAEGGNSVASMMRGELPSDSARPGWDSGGSQAPTLAPMEEWEIRKIQQDAQKAEKKAEKEKKESEIQARKDLEKTGLKDHKKLAECKEKLKEMDAIKEKDWDELTEDDEAALEGEVELRAVIAELEKKCKD
mmetsp:Transcript_54904/g.139154  ORF Transcript_54904/g.139154 Transcript_54904/m.139154 type:complete len:633 (+) Transcript_54904:104-2002(+)